MHKLVACVALRTHNISKAAADHVRSCIALSSRLVKFGGAPDPWKQRDGTYSLGMAGSINRVTVQKIAVP